MRTYIQNVYFTLALLALATFNSQLSTAHAQGTAFTYQGQLSSGGAPANGSYDLQFTLYTVNAGGVALAGPVTNSATAVSNGLFTTTIDFGPGVFTGTSNWLDIAVRTNGATGFTELTPRQQIKPTPYAVFATTASNVSGTVSASQLTGSIPAGQVTGTIPLAQLPPAVVTNNSVTSVNLNGTFTGNGSGLTGLPASHLTFGDTNNTYFGYESLPATTGQYNTAFGYETLNYNSIGVGNTAIGAQAMALNTSGADNTAYGGSALYSSVTGRENTAIGGAALYGLGENGFAEGGTNNIAVGYMAGTAYEDNESSNIDIGNPGVEFENNTIHIGRSQTNTFIAGVINGNGGGLTNLNVTQFSSGVVPTSVLPGFQAASNYATVGGGVNNTASGIAAVVGGGGYDGTTYSGNLASGNASVIGGGAGNQATNTYATVGGGNGNTASGEDSTIAGGGGPSQYGNQASGGWSAIGGGDKNAATNSETVIGGGQYNTAGGVWATIGGGDANVNLGNAGTIAGGQDNFAGGQDSFGDDYYQPTVGGGYNNFATNDYATVPGGALNIAGGLYSFAAGQEALALNQGAFVWADSQQAPFASTNNDSFNVRAQGGVNLVTSGAGLMVDGPVTANGVNGNLNVNNVTASGNLTANNTPGVNWSQGGSQIDIPNAGNIQIDACGNLKPAVGYFVITASATVYSGNNNVGIQLVDTTSGTTYLTYATGKNSDSQGGIQVYGADAPGYVTLSLSWVVPITTSGGYENFAVVAYSDGNGSYVINHNLTVMYFPRQNN